MVATFYKGSRLCTEVVWRVHRFCTKRVQRKWTRRYALNTITCAIIYRCFYIRPYYGVRR